MILKKPLGDAGHNEYAMNTNRSVEHLAELQGRTGSIRYRQMSRGDDQVGMILRVHKNPILSANWNIVAPDDATEQETLAIDILKKWFFTDARPTFSTLLTQILSYLEYGFCVFEQYYQTYRYDENLYLVPVLEQRVQTSIENIYPDKRIVQQFTIEKGMQDIPFENLVFFILNQQGEDMRGESLLRNAYKSWTRKNLYQEWEGMGIQRVAIGGVPYIKVGKGVSPDSDDYAAAETLLKNISAHEDAYMIVQEGWDFGIVESKFNAEQVRKVIDGCNAAMALSVLAQFVLLGQNGNTGAFALSRDQSDFFLDGLQYVIGQIEEVFNREIITPFVKFNFGDGLDPERVKLKGTNLNKKAGQELANVLNTLGASRFMRPTVNDEIHLRSIMDMPELSEEEIEERKKSKEQRPQIDQAPDDQQAQDMEDDAEDQTDDDAVNDKDKVRKFAEPKLKSRREFIDKNTKEVLDFMKANLLMIKDKLMADIEATLNRGEIEIQGLKKVEVSSAKYLKALERKLAGIAIESWSDAKKSAKVNIKFAEGAEPKEIKDKVLRQYVLNQSQSTVDQQTANLLNRAIITASNGPLKGFSIAQTVSNVGRAIDEYIDSNGVQVSGSLIVVGTSNFGASQFYKEIEDQLWGYRFVAIDDDLTSDICQWHNGKTYSINSPELAMATPPLHPNCRSYMEPVYKSEEKPEIDDAIAPPSIQKQKSIF